MRKNIPVLCAATGPAMLFAAMLFAAMLFAAMLFAAGARAQSTQAATQTLTVTLFAPLGGPNFSPAAPSLVCTSPPGTAVAQAAAIGGNGKPIAWSMTGSADFAIDAATGAITVAPGGIAAADCPASGTSSLSLSVTAAQPL